jgi:hypothetical protein
MFSDYKFHPSSLGLIMTESRTKEELGETAKAHLMECYVSRKYGRRKDVTNAYIEKGLMAEEDSMDLYTLVKDQLFVKNKETIENDYFIGTPDILVLDKPPFEKVLEVIDLKTSWDIFTFFSVMHKPMNKNYYWQLQAYMDLTGAQKAKLVYCLVNTPFKLIEDQKKKLMWTMGVIDPDTDEAYQKACEMVDKNSIYDDIPMEERYIEFEIDRDQEAIDKAHARVEFCRNFLNQL